MPVTEHLGDIFKVPRGSVLIHSCNCQGDWGSGVAAAFRDKVSNGFALARAAWTNTVCAQFPAAYRSYRKHCTVPGTLHTQKRLLGTTLLIPPQEEDIELSGSYWIACLMTSLYYGKRKDKPDTILDNTRKAMADLKKQIVERENHTKRLQINDKLYTVRINSAAFNVAWNRSKGILEESLMPLRVMNNVNVMSAKDKARVLREMKEAGFDTESEAIFTKPADAPNGPRAEEDATGATAPLPVPEDVARKDRKRKAKEPAHEDSDNGQEVPPEDDAHTIGQKQITDWFKQEDQTPHKSKQAKKSKHSSSSSSTKG
jgi:ADP-ribose 1''-phosphate phosphatase